MYVKIPLRYKWNENKLDSYGIDAHYIRIGENFQVGNNVKIKCYRLEVGDNFRIADNVEIDVSGGMTKQSNFIAGDNCLLCKDVYVNCCREVILGNHVCLSPRAMVFTHRYWQDVRKGYDNAFKPVIFGNDSWLGAGAVVLPGCEIGQGSIIMANSTVIGNVPERTLYGGVPAVKLKDIRDKDNFVQGEYDEYVRLREEFLGRKEDEKESLRRFGINRE